MTRAAVSIASNVAGGSSRKSDKDYHRFIEISLGSLFELETQLLLSKAIGFSEETAADSLLNNLYEEQKMLSAFMHALK